MFDIGTFDNSKIIKVFVTFEISFGYMATTNKTDLEYFFHLDQTPCLCLDLPSRCSFNAFSFSFVEVFCNVGLSQ